MITTQILLIERKVECGRSDDSDLLRRRRQHARASCAYSVKRMYGIDKGVDCAATTHATGTNLYSSAYYMASAFVLLENS